MRTMKSHQPSTNDETKLDTVVDQLRREILERKIPSGEWLRQDILAKQFGVSPTPIREALRRLESDGLVEYIPRHGVRVISHSFDNAKEYYDLRSMVEPYAVRLTADRISESDLHDLRQIMSRAEEFLKNKNMVELSRTHWKFHETIIELCGSSITQNILARIRRSFQLDTLPVIPDRAEKSFEEHVAILKALEDRDSDLAAELVKRNIENSRQAMFSRFPQLMSGYFL